MKWTHVVIFGLICIIVALGWFNTKMKQEMKLQKEAVTTLPVSIGDTSPLPNIEVPITSAPDPVAEKPKGNDVGMEYPETDITTGDTIPVACTMDAKICPDGTGVGRTGPNCEFAPCP